MIGLPFALRRIHFVGIGGIGMSGIAELMVNLGYEVQGSDLVRNANVERLARLGVKVFLGHEAANVAQADAVVVSSAIAFDNPEVRAARERHLPLVRRAEMLAELMRLKYCVSVAGSHGKTTTTSLCAAMLEAGNFDPTVVNGGIINAYGSNARLGGGDWMVVEADESDGSFVKLPATLAVVTNIDPEHLDFYGDFETEKAAFLQFVENIPFYGAAVLCLDHPEVQGLIARLGDRRVVSYGFSPQAQVRGENLHFAEGVAEFDVALAERRGRPARRIEGLRLEMPGRHNVQNALAAIAVADEMGIAEETIRRTLAGFRGVRRRFTKVGEAAGVTVIDDYGHHPVEIAAVLEAAREAWPGRRIVAVVQPHRFSRLEALFEDFCTAFNAADRVIVTPVYAAGEAPRPGVDHEALARGLAERGHRAVATAEGEHDLPDALAGDLRRGDLVICLGAGSISRWAQDLPIRLGELLARHGGEAGR